MKAKRVLQFNQKELLAMAKWLETSGLSEIRMDMDTNRISGVEHTTSANGYGYSMLGFHKKNDYCDIHTLKRD